MAVFTSNIYTWHDGKACVSLFFRFLNNLIGISVANKVGSFAINVGRLSAGGN